MSRRLDGGRARGRAMVLAVALAAVACVAAPAHAAPAAGDTAGVATRRPGHARVSYLAGASVYVDAGRAEGLADGDTVRIVRAGREIALLRVSVASTHRAACDTLAVGATLAIGDIARFDPRVAAPADPPLAVADTAATGPDPAEPSPAARPRRGRWRGHVGMSHLVATLSGGATTHQPAIHLRLDTSGLPFEASFDLRTRRTIAVADSGVVRDASTTRLYRGALTLHGASGRARLSVGRQTAASLSPVSTFDGALARWSAGAFAVGGFAGTQPDAVTWGFSSGVTEYGGFVDWQPRPRDGRRASATVGAVTSYDHGHPNRDFAFAQGTWQGPRWFAVASQELDFGRAWERALGEDAATWSSSYAMLRVTPRDGLVLQGGFDGRRTVRLWRDRVNPETEFDDRHRQGAWLGAGVDATRWLRVTADARVRTGGGDDATTWNGGLELRRFAPAVTAVRLRGSVYDSDRSTSRLLSATVGLDPWSGVHLEAGGGARATRDPFVGLDSRATWQTVDADVALGGRWFALGSWDHEGGDGPGAHRVLLGLQRSF